MQYQRKSSKTLQACAGSLLSEVDINVMVIERWRVHVPPFLFLLHFPHPRATQDGRAAWSRSIRPADASYLRARDRCPDRDIERSRKKRIRTKAAFPDKRLRPRSNGSERVRVCKTRTIWFILIVHARLRSLLVCHFEMIFVFVFPNPTRGTSAVTIGSFILSNNVHQTFSREALKLSE